MKRTICMYILTMGSACAILIFSSCTKSIVGTYIGDLDFNERYTSYASLELKKDNSFVLKQETMTVESTTASSFVTSTEGSYKMSFNKLKLSAIKARDAETSYRLNDLKTYRVLYTDSRVPLDTYNVTQLMIPVDTTYGDYQVFSEVHKTKFKKSQANNSIYFIGSGAVFSKKKKTGNSLDVQTNCPNLYEINRAPVNKY